MNDTEKILHIKLSLSYFCSNCVNIQLYNSQSVANSAILFDILQNEATLQPIAMQ